MSSLENFILCYSLDFECNRISFNIHVRSLLVYPIVLSHSFIEFRIFGFNSHWIHCVERHRLWSICFGSIWKECFLSGKFVQTLCDRLQSLKFIDRENKKNNRDKLKTFEAKLEENDGWKKSYARQGWSPSASFASSVDLLSKKFHISMVSSCELLTISNSSKCNRNTRSVCSC